eukprot:TRINITY_DN5195_c0_g1_i3.p1 TRINITY_DN5195_c0_g1~~TRINITY_DN5195_c0_g1_i3.p1  ORF type:complete len:164 (+),score=35.64 TRINITY_DN5195_c0_g1_i3:100-591(+)
MSPERITQLRQERFGIDGKMNVVSAIKEKDEDLLAALRPVSSNIVNAPSTNPPSSSKPSKRALPQSRQPAASSLEWRADSVENGLSYRRLLQFYLNRKTAPKSWTPESLSMEYDLDVDTVKQILRYYTLPFVVVNHGRTLAVRELLPGQQGPLLGEKLLRRSK